MIYIGIDLSTTNVGFAMIKRYNKGNVESYGLVMSGSFELKKYSYENIFENFKIFDEWIDHLFLNSEHLKESENIEVGIEVANFSSGTNKKFNPLLGQRFSYYAGIISSLFFKKTKVKKIKLFNANEWFRFIDDNYISLSREIRKLKAHEFVNKTFKIKARNEDEADAICIAYFLPYLKDTTERAEFTKEIKREKKKKMESKKSKLQKLKSEMNKKQLIIKEYDLILKHKKLTKPQLARYKRTKQEIVEIETLICEINFERGNKNVR